MIAIDGDDARLRRGEGAPGRLGARARAPGAGGRPAQAREAARGSPPRGCATAATTSRRHRELRFDVVGLRLDAAGRVVEYEHLRGAF